MKLDDDTNFGINIKIAGKLFGQTDHNTGLIRQDLGQSHQIPSGQLDAGGMLRNPDDTTM